MTTLAYTVPVAGTDLNSLADPEIQAALNAILTWANGGIDQANISPSSGYARLAMRTLAVSGSLNSGDVVIAAAGVTATLPAPASNALVAVFADSSVTAASPVAVSGSNINGLGVNGASSFQLGIPGAVAVLQSDGTKWYLVAGEQDSGWAALVLATNVQAATNYYPPAVRLRGSEIQLRGNMQNNTGGIVAAGSTIATSVALGPQFNVFLNTANPLAPATAIGISILSRATAILTGDTWPAGAQCCLDGLRYSLQ